MPKGWQALHYTILSDATLAVVATDVDLAAEWARIRKDEGLFSKPSRINRLTRSGRARLMTWSGADWDDGPSFPLETPHPLLARFADGRWLVVGSRTRGEPNARVFSSDGALLARFVLGDGIEHVVIDNADRIWVGWFDEGIFGNTGWRVPGHEWPPSANGVARFNDAGGLIELPAWPIGIGFIADCYALTPAGSGVWVLPYTEFPLVRFDAGKPARWWSNQLAGPKAIAVDGNYALVAGGYDDDAARLALLELQAPGPGKAAALLATWRMPLRPLTRKNDWAPPWEKPALLAGQGDCMYLIDDGYLHKWQVKDAVAAAGCL